MIELQNRFHKIIYFGMINGKILSLVEGIPSSNIYLQRNWIFEELNYIVSLLKSMPPPKTTTTTTRKWKNLKR